MRYVVVVALVVGMLLAGSQSHAKTRRACTGWNYRVDHRTADTVRYRRIIRLVRCVFHELGIAEEVPTAIAVGDRESSFAPWAHNVSSDARGLFQHLGAYWGSRSRALPPIQFPRWPESSAFNARANTWAAARMVRASGWGAWTTV